MIQFAFYHGTSTHYLSHFELGKPPKAWGHFDDALALYRGVWGKLESHGVVPEWFESNIINQSSSASNWQHGSFYITPSQGKAMGYSDSNSAYGGELLTMCANAIKRLAGFSAEDAQEVSALFPSLEKMLSGSGERVVVEIRGVSSEDIVSESGSRDVEKDLEALIKMDEKMREIAGGGMNFRLLPGRGVVAGVEIVGRDK